LFLTTIFARKSTMTAIQQAEALLPQISERDAIVLFSRFFDRSKSIGRGIAKTPGVCGGRACIEGTRMPVWSLANHRFLGFTDWEILYNFPTVTPNDLKNAWRYYEANKTEIDVDIKENETDDDPLEQD
jgi:uncharacterized protein (DUF433 family)